MTRFGPSFSHSLGALGFVLVFGTALAAMSGNGPVGALGGAWIATAWFAARELEQVQPHYGWKSWRVYASSQDKQRAIRQAVWPAAVAHMVPLMLWFIR